MPKNNINVPNPVKNFLTQKAREERDFGANWSYSADDWKFLRDQCLKVCPYGSFSIGQIKNVMYSARAKVKRENVVGYQNREGGKKKRSSQHEQSNKKRKNAYLTADSDIRCQKIDPLTQL